MSGMRRGMRMQKHRGMILGLCVAVVFAAAAGVMVYGAYAGTGMPLLDGKADQLVTGKPNMVNLAPSDTAVQPLSTGVTPFGSLISGASNAARPPESGITPYLDIPAGGESMMFTNYDDTADSGNTLYLTFESGTTIVTNDTNGFVAGVSAFEISGTTLERRAVVWSPQAGVYVVDVSGSPTVRSYE